ncbi:uncharacterized protein [Haliotis asinina]|uniref:uncharacterized protein isoform X2 n=1 Tax=Haliotis asinina TaxID=109174 RepID=UPI003531F257
MAAQGKLSVECSGESDHSFIVTNHSTFASPTLSSLPATHSSQGSSKSRLHVSCLESSQSGLFIDRHHFSQVENTDPTNVQRGPVVIKVEVKGDDVKTVNVDRDQEDVVIKLQVCDPSKKTSDLDDASILKSISDISMSTTIKLFMVSQVVFLTSVSCFAMLKGNVVTIHNNNVYNYHQTPPLPTNIGDGNYRSGDAASVNKLEPTHNSITGDDRQRTDAAVPVNQMEQVPVNSTGDDNYRLDATAPVYQMEPTLDSSTGNDKHTSDEAVSEASMHSRSTPVGSPDKMITSKKCMIRCKQLMPQAGFKNYLSLLFSAEPPQSNRIYPEMMTSRHDDAKNQERIFQRDHKDHCFWESSRTEASVRTRLAYSCPDDQEDIDVKQLQKGVKRSTMTKDFTALAMQGDSSNKQEAKSVAGAGHDNLTQSLGNFESLISPLLQVLAITVSLFIATYAFAKTILQLLFAVTERLNSFLDNGKHYLSCGRNLISSICIKLQCHVVAMLLPNHVPRYFGMMMMIFMECSGFSESPNSFDSGTPGIKDRSSVHSNQRRQSHGEDVKPASYQYEAMSVPKNVQNVNISGDDAHEHTDPDESYAQNHFDDTNQTKRRDDPPDKTEAHCLSLNEVDNIQDFAKGIAPDALEIARSGFQNTGLQDPSACSKEHDSEVQKGIPSLPDDSAINLRNLPGKKQIHSKGRCVFDNSLETDAGDNESAQHAPHHLNTQDGSRDFTAFQDLVKHQKRDFEQPILPDDVQLDERLHMPPKRKYVWPHQHCIHGEMYDMMNFILGIESALDGTGVFIQVSPLHVLNGDIQSWMVKPLSDLRTAYFDHVGEAPYIEEKVEIETFLQIRRKYEVYISHQDDEPDTLKIYGLTKCVKNDHHFVKIIYQCREAAGYIHVFLTFQTRRRRFNQVHRVPSGQTLKAVMAHPAIHNFVSQLKQVYTVLEDGCYMTLTLEGRHIYPSPSWRVNRNCIIEIVPSIKGGMLPSTPHSPQRCAEGQEEPA